MKKYNIKICLIDGIPLILMLASTLKYQKAFEQIEEEDEEYVRFFSVDETT